VNPLVIQEQEIVVVVVFTIGSWERAQGRVPLRLKGKENFDSNAHSRPLKGSIRAQSPAGEWGLRCANMQICICANGVAYTLPFLYRRSIPGVSLEGIHSTFTVGSLYVHGRFTEAPLWLSKGWLRVASYLSPIKSVLRACFPFCQLPTVNRQLLKDSMILIATLANCRIGQLTIPGINLSFRRH
jgi:hypothetical protein